MTLQPFIQGHQQAKYNIISRNVPKRSPQTRRNTAVRSNTEGNYYTKTTQPHTVSRKSVAGRAGRNDRAQNERQEWRHEHMQPRSGLTSMHAEAGPNGPRLQRVAVVDMAVPRVISTSVPLQTSRMKTGSASTQGGRGQGARYALLVSHPLARCARRIAHAGRLTARARASKPAQEHWDRKQVGPENEPFKATGLQIACERRRCAFGVSWVAWA